jgi:hypothetical protein
MVRGIITCFDPKDMGNQKAKNRFVLNRKNKDSQRFKTRSPLNNSGSLSSVIF